MRKSLMSLVSSLRRRPRLTEVERAIVEAIASRLPKKEREILDLQLEAISKIQRLPDGVGVNFYMRSDRGNRCETPPQFANSDDFVMAKAVIALPIFDVTLDAEVRCVTGHLFSVEYRGSVRYFDEAVGMDPSPELVVTVRGYMFGDRAEDDV